MFTIDPESSVPKRRQVKDELARMIIGEIRDFDVGPILFAVLDNDDYAFGINGRYITATIKLGGGRKAKRVTRTG